MAIEGENMEAVTDFLFLGSNITAVGICSHAIRRWLFFGRKAMTNLDSVLNSRHHLAEKSPYSKGYDLSSSHVWLWELYCQEGRMPKNWHFQTVVLEKTAESPLDSKEINQSILREINPEYSLEDWC